MKNKILSLSQAQAKVKFLKKKKNKVVLCHGVFDIIHPGHLEYFNYAKKFGQTLVVSVTTDRFVDKGFGRPIFDIEKRKFFLSNISIIDFIVESDYPSSVNIIKKLKPNFYVKGPDFKIKKNDHTGKIYSEVKAIKSVKGRYIVSKGFTSSSSKIINDNFIPKNEQDNFIQKISKNYNQKQIIEFINDFKKLNVLVIGEAIIDEYNFCETIGKSGKEPVLNVRKIFAKKYLGGSLAICQNLSSFCNKVSVISYLGENNEESSFIKKKLANNIKTIFINKKKSPTVLKRRFLENITNIKTLGVYSVNDDYINISEEKKIIKHIRKIAKKVDLIIVSDYGHGLITKKISKLISTYKNKYFVNAQLNSNNLGNHNLENYRNAKAIVINENELRHELRDKHSELVKLGKSIRKKRNAKSVLITQGKDGATLIEKNRNIKSPAFAKYVSDKIGSGDSMLSMFSICSTSKMNSLLNLYLSALAAANNVQTVANETPIEKNNIIKIIKHHFN